MPFVHKRLRGHRTGDGFQPKRPELLPLEAPFGGRSTVSP
jgi:hypothetical protein